MIMVASSFRVRVPNPNFEANLTVIELTLHCDVKHMTLGGSDICNAYAALVAASCDAAADNDSEEMDDIAMEMGAKKGRRGNFVFC